MLRYGRCSSDMLQYSNVGRDVTAVANGEKERTLVYLIFWRAFSLLSLGLIKVEVF